MEKSTHPTTRRGVIAALGFGGVSLYGLWAAYGAAPGPMALLRLAQADSGADHSPAAPAAIDAHGEHGMAVSGPATDKFRAEVAEFIDRFAMPDGSVYPQPAGPMTAMAPANNTLHGGSSADHAGDLTTGPSAPNLPAPSHAAAGNAAMASHVASGEHDAGPVDVYMLAEQWFYEPGHLRLDPGTRYRFRMMAADVPHGASIQFGLGARMIRLRPDIVTEVEMTFDRPGSYFVYCTVYCAQGHDAMQARIDVV